LIINGADPEDRGKMQPGTKKRRTGCVGAYPFFRSPGESKAIAIGPKPRSDQALRWSPPLTGCARLSRQGALARSALPK
jgi:hypothetical protein